ncbi:MAG: hypothetical protein WCV72_03675 [Patescibacteria group bacterium]
MENRLIFFASAAESQSENSEAPKSETGAEDLQKAGADLAQLENLKAKPGGHENITQARGVIDRQGTSDFVKDLLNKKITAVEAAASARQNKATPETTAALDKANAELAKSVKFQKERIAGNATADSEFGRLASLGNANELFKDVKVSVQSASKGSAELKWKGNSLEEFRKLGLEQKKAFLKEMNKSLLDSPAATTAILDKFSKDSRLPKKWQEYAKNPEGSGHTKKHAAEWLTTNADKKILQAETAFKFLEGKQSLLTKAGEKIPSRDEIFGKSTSEFNQYIEGIKTKIATVDAEQAKHFESLKVSEGAQIQKTETQNTAAIEKAEAETKSQAEKLAPQLQKFKIDRKLGEKAAERELELEKSGKKEVATADNVSNLRQRAQAGESVGVGAKLKGLLSFGKKAAADDYNKGSAEGAKDGVVKNGAAEKETDKKDEKPKESMAARARREVASETLRDQKNAEEFSKTLGLKNVSQEQAAQLAALLALEKTDAESVKMQLSPEIKAILARQAADDYEQKKAA